MSNDTMLSVPTKDAGAWDIVKSFAEGDNISLPETEEWLQCYLGSQYAYNDWKAAFDAVLHAEDDTATSVAAVEKLRTEAIAQALAPVINDQPSSQLRPVLPQLTTLETELMDSVAELKNRKRIVGTTPTL